MKNNDEFRITTSQMALLLHEIGHLEQKLKDNTNTSVISTIAFSLREKRAAYDTLKTELHHLGKLGAEAAPTGLPHNGISKPVPIGCGDGEYYLDDDRNTGQ
jgi:hypothetical protein